MCQRQRHRGQTLGGRVHQHHGVFLPGFAGRLVAQTSPQVDHFLAVVEYTTGAAQLIAPREIFGKRIPHGLETRLHLAFDLNV